ncbi:hypothetical protein ACTMU2_27465 [Cupriavidus basilensis]
MYRQHARQWLGAGLPDHMRADSLDYAHTDAGRDPAPGKRPCTTPAWPA